MATTMTESGGAAVAPARNERRALAGLAVATLLAALGTSSANVALPALAQAFGAPFQAVQWVVLAYLLAVTALIVGAGRLGDLYGRRRVLLAGIGLFTAASALCGAAPSLGVLIGARAVQGLGAAFMMAMAMALAGGLVPKERTGRAMGLLGTMSAIGTAAGPALGGLLLEASGWRVLFLAQAPLGVALLGHALRALPADSAADARETRRFDTAGTALLAATLAAWALAMTLGRGRFGADNLLLLVIAAGGLLAFLFTERRVASPLIPAAALRDPALARALVASTLVTTVLMTTLVVGPFHLAHALGLGPAAVGIALAAGPVVAALAGTPAGRLVDHLGAARMVRAGLVAIAAGSLLIAALPPTLGVAGYVGPILVITAGFALFQAANNTAVMAGVVTEWRGVVSGLLNLARNFGLVTGAAAMAAVFGTVVGAPDIATAGIAAVARGTRATFAVAAVLIGAALWVQRRGIRPAGGSAA